MIKELNFIKNYYKKKEPLLPSFKELPEKQKGIVAAVDGGSSVLADGGVWVISKLKVASVVYDGNIIPEKLYKKEHYYTLIKDETINHSIHELKPEFGNIRELSEAPSVTMKTLEFKRAYELSKELPKESVLLIDGLLAPENTDQEKLLAGIRETAGKRNVNVVGLAKTFRQGINGRSVIGTLLSKRPFSKWIYRFGDYFIVKLHERSSYAYAFNCFCHDFKKTLSILSYYARDPEIIGYPYPLIKADKEARISSYELANEINKLRIISKKEGYDFINFDVRSTDMHSLMDKQKYRS